MHRRTALIALITAALTFSAALVVRVDVFAQTVEPTPPPAVLAPAPVADPVAEAQALVDRAEQAQQRTQDMLNFALTFIQGGSIIVTAIFGVVAANNFIDSRRLRKEMESQINSVNEATTRYGKLLTDLETQKTEIDSNMRRLNARLEEATRLRDDLNARIESATRALSLSHLGTRQVDLGNMQVARNLFLEALRLDPDNEVINYFVGDLYLRDGRIDEGKDHLERAIKSSSFPAAEATYAYALRLCGDREGTPSIRADYYRRAEEIFKHVSTVDSHLLDISGESAFGALAGLYRREGRIAEAIEWYDHARSITPQNSYPVNNLGILHYRFTGQEGTNRATALEYFRESRRKALYLLKVAESYWTYFDLITADAVLEQASFEDIKGHITRMFELQPPHNDLHKLIRGLTELNDAPNPAPMIRRVIAEVERRMSRSA